MTTGNETGNKGKLAHIEILKKLRKVDLRIKKVLSVNAVGMQSL